MIYRSMKLQKRKKKTQKKSKKMRIRKIPNIKDNKRVVTYL